MLNFDRVAFYDIGKTTPPSMTNSTCRKVLGRVAVAKEDGGEVYFRQ